MIDSEDLVNGPLCEGHGELRRVELVERLSDGEPKSKVDSAVGSSYSKRKNSQRRQPSAMATKAATFRRMFIVGTRSCPGGEEARRSEPGSGADGIEAELRPTSGVEFLTAHFIDFRRL